MYRQEIRELLQRLPRKILRVQFDHRKETDLVDKDALEKTVGHHKERRAR